MSKNFESYDRKKRKLRGFPDGKKHSTMMSGRMHKLALKCVEEDPDISRLSELIRIALANELRRRGFEYEEPRVMTLREVGATPVQIKTLLHTAQRPMNTFELAETLDINKRTMYSALYDLATEGEVVKLYNKQVQVTYKRKGKYGEIEVTRPIDIAFWQIADKNDNMSRKRAVFSRKNRFNNGN